MTNLLDATRPVDAYQHNNSEEAKLIRETNSQNTPSVSGIENDFSMETNITYDAGKSEYIINGPTRSFMIMGRDRSAGKSSGLGGIGATGCAAVDIIAGFGGTRPLRSYKDSATGEKKIEFTNKNFHLDISRLYLSEKTLNIDYDLAIPEPTIKFWDDLDIPLESNSLVGTAALISDTVRLKARENIKIVTAHNQVNSSGHPAVNNGIALIAGANRIGEAGMSPKLLPQPMVKGNNLVSCLTYISTLIKNLQTNVANIVDNQMIINQFVLSHKHQSGPSGLPTNEMLEEITAKMKEFRAMTTTIKDIVENYKDIGLFRQYFSYSSDECILSLYNVNN